MCLAKEFIDTVFVTDRNMSCKGSKCLGYLERMSESNIRPIVRTPDISAHKGNKVADYIWLKL